jgi:hypothetical protein
MMPGILASALRAAALCAAFTTAPAISSNLVWVLILTE